jgi:hypothetical protein
VSRIANELFLDASSLLATSKASKSGKYKRWDTEPFNEV